MSSTLLDLNLYHYILVFFHLETLLTVTQDPNVFCRPLLSYILHRNINTKWIKSNNSDKDDEQGYSLDTLPELHGIIAAIFPAVLS